MCALADKPLWFTSLLTPSGTCRAYAFWRSPEYYALWWAMRVLLVSISMASYTFCDYRQAAYSDSGQEKR